MSSSPWNAVSLHDFWSTKWHQVLRHPILVSGGYPLQSILLFLASPFPLKRSTTRIIGDIGLLVGSFTASGLIHHFAMYPIGPGKMPGWPCIGFFMAQSLGMICERIYRAATGRRVGGWIGTMWTWCWIIGGGQICSESPEDRFTIGTNHLIISTLKSTRGIDLGSTLAFMSLHH